MDDFDVEAMLEAPFKADKPGEHEGPREEVAGLYDDLVVDRAQKRDDKKDERRERGGRSERERDRDRDRGDRDRDRRRSRSPPRRERERERERDRPRRLTKEEVQLQEIERDSRTVFVMQLAARVRPRDIEDFFELGEYKLKVKDVRLVTDRNTRKSKGVGYVEFKEKQSVTKAIAMSGTKLLGIPMIIQHTESEKNRIAEEAARAAAELAAASSTSATAITVAATGGPAANALSRIYVGSLDFTLTEDDIRSLFEIHGPIDFVNLHKDSETGRSKGFAFVQFKRAENAKQALEKMHGYELKGRQLKVGYSTEADKSGLAYNATVGLANALAAKGGNGLMTSLDEEEKLGVALSAQARAALMANLARRDDPSAPSVAVPVVAKLEVSATRCVLLKNMFDPTQETEPDWDTEIRQDVKEECGKYGKIVHIAVDKNSQGFIYIKFDAIPFAQQAINALNGRFFAGKQISATFMLDVVYHAKYPEAAYL